MQKMKKQLQERIYQGVIHPKRTYFEKEGLKPLLVTTKH